MSLTNVKADGNVPFQSNRPRYKIVGVEYTTIVQQMASGDFNGKRATTVAQPNPDLVDPAVKGGQALWTGLNNGGVFFLGGPGARPAVIGAVYAQNCTPTYNIVAMDDP